MCVCVRARNEGERRTGKRRRMEMILKKKSRNRSFDDFFLLLLFFSEQWRFWNIAAVVASVLIVVMCPTDRTFIVTNNTDGSREQRNSLKCAVPIGGHKPMVSRYNRINNHCADVIVRIAFFFFSGCCIERYYRVLMVISRTAGEN